MYNFDRFAPSPCVFVRVAAMSKLLLLLLLAMALFAIVDPSVTQRTRGPDAPLCFAAASGRPAMLCFFPFSVAPLDDHCACTPDDAGSLSRECADAVRQRHWTWPSAVRLALCIAAAAVWPVDARALRRHRSRTDALVSSRAGKAPQIRESGWTGGSPSRWAKSGATNGDCRRRASVPAFSRPRTHRHVDDAALAQAIPRPPGMHAWRAPG